MAGPLEGVKIVDLSQVIAGPLATTWLADQGADVIKVEDRHGDPSRTIGTRKGDMSALFLACNRNKRSIVLDLKTPEGTAALEALVREADVLVQNFRPGVIERLGFAYERLERIAPRLIFCSMSGFGTTGPRAGARVYDAVMQAAAGFATQQAASGGPPDLIRSYICDKTTALIAAQAITAALYARERTGRGQKVELNMFDAGIAFFWPEGMQNYTFADEPPAAMPDVGDTYRLWPTRDGHVAIAAPKLEEFRAVTRAIGCPEMADDPRFATLTARNENRGAYQAALAAAIATWSTDELDARFRTEDAAAGRVNSRADLLDDAQAKANGTIIEMDGGALGRVRTPRHPARFSLTPAGAPTCAPKHGEHTAALLAGLAPKS